MAKWGEGDPRWIVEERPDATNVNNWHWTEKNACAWSQDKIRELFSDMKIEGDGVSCTITAIDKCEGEAVVHNRKGKLIFFYEWNIWLKWMSYDKYKTKVEGKINIPNLSEENDISEVDVMVTLQDSTNEGEEIKHYLHKKGQDLIRKKLEKYVASLKKEFTKGMILPKKEGIEQNNSQKSVDTSLKEKMNISAQVTTNDKVGCSMSTTTIKQQQKFQCRAIEFFNAFTKLEMVRAFTRGEVKLEPVKGGKFELFGGNICGEFVEVSTEKIVQKWRRKQWSAGHYSEVTIHIVEKIDHTEINLIQTLVPSSEEDTTKENWERYYWDSMKRTFGFGYFM